MKKIFLLGILVFTVNIVKAALMPNSFHMEFEQVHESLLKKKKKVTKVSLDYKYPSKIVLKTGLETIYTSNGSKSWYYTAPFIPTEQGEVVVQNKVELGLLKFFDSLKNGLTKNDYFDYELKGSELIFHFKEKGISELSLERAIFLTKEKKTADKLELSDFIQIKLMKANERAIVLNIKEIDTKRDFPNKHFIFSPPKNTKTIQR